MADWKQLVSMQILNFSHKSDAKYEKACRVLFTGQNMSKLEVPFHIYFHISDKLILGVWTGSSKLRPLDFLHKDRVANLVGKVLILFIVFSFSEQRLFLCTKINVSSLFLAGKPPGSSFLPLLFRVNAKFLWLEFPITFLFINT